MRRVALIALAIFVLDQITKIAVVFGLDLKTRGEIDVLPPLLNFRMAWNQGVNFGLFASGTEWVRWGLIVLSLVIVAWVWRWTAKAGHGPLARASAGVLIGGALGNVVDRVAYGAVADFLNMSCCGIENPYAFNVADIAIFAGAIGLVLFTGPDVPARKSRRKTP
ncbi:signal peptidase II [Gemmobacter denitrificans]|uniref:Lipoprotein signal peptidase n=1 Tax=Gemmobacter denitrificans TaxID=3123040 RepID=A0ABU8BZZ7_9RHOB